MLKVLETVPRKEVLVRTTMILQTLQFTPTDRCSRTGVQPTDQGLDQSYN